MLEVKQIVASDSDNTLIVVKKLDKFCGLIYRARKMYPRSGLIMFYNSFAKSVTCYSLSVFGKAAKANLKKNRNLPEKKFKSNFFPGENRFTGRHFSGE